MAYFVPVEEASPGYSPEEMSAEETIGIPFPTDREVGTFLFEPSFSGKARSAGMGRILTAYFGDPVTTQPDAGGAPTAYQHVWDAALPAALVPRAHSILMNRTDPDPAITDLLWDAIGQELTFSVEPNDWISFESSWVAGQVDQDRPEPTVSADLTRRFPFYETKAHVSIDGGAEAELAVGSFSLGYSMNVPTDDFILGSRTLYGITPGNRDATLSFRAREQLADYYRRAMDLEPESVKFRLQSLGPIIGGAVRHELEVTTHRSQVIEAPAEISAADLLNGIDVTARSAYDATAGKFVSVKLVNTIASY
jgi:hypothetical protein